MIRVPSSVFRLACIVTLLVPLLGTMAYGGSPGAIAEADILSLQEKLAFSGDSTVAVRMAMKNVARRGQALLKEAPDAPNRFVVLGIIFQSQKRLLGLENREENRAAIFETCRKLMDAPNEYAEARFEAEMLLSERDLAAAEATVAQRVKALEDIIARYRGTPAEARSLMIAALIAGKLQAFDLEKSLFDTMRDRFAGHHDVIQWRRKHFGLGKLEVTFAGTYTRADGVPLHFPLDRMGHLCIMVFWSRETPGFELYLKQIQELQVQYPDRFDVFSFNLDDLPDAGEKILRKCGVDWAPMRLPGGARQPGLSRLCEKGSGLRACQSDRVRRPAAGKLSRASQSLYAAGQVVRAEEQALSQPPTVAVYRGIPRGSSLRAL